KIRAARRQLRGQLASVRLIFVAVELGARKMPADADRLLVVAIEGEALEHRMVVDGAREIATHAIEIAAVSERVESRSENGFGGGAVPSLVGPRGDQSFGQAPLAGLELRGQVPL